VRVLVIAIVAYIVIGLLYSTAWTIYLELTPTHGSGDVPPPWSSPMAFVAWFLLPAALWPWNLVGFHGVPEVLVVCAYLATFGLFYLGASRRSAPRRLKSTYPNHH
jgi:hypothetical protein